MVLCDKKITGYQKYVNCGQFKWPWQCAGEMWCALRQVLGGGDDMVRETCMQEPRRVCRINPWQHIDHGLLVLFIPNSNGASCNFPHACSIMQSPLSDYMRWHFPEVTCGALLPQDTFRCSMPNNNSWLLFFWLTLCTRPKWEPILETKNKKNELFLNWSYDVQALAVGR